eukprot:NODE_144_length_17694_cov_0.489741.p10 type:complete len:140 gc:universal NODE_144_length_17694_cov_0.489741:7579-7998(+)
MSVWSALGMVVKSSTLVDSLDTRLESLRFSFVLFFKSCLDSCFLLTLSNLANFEEMDLIHNCCKLTCSSLNKIISVPILIPNPSKFFRLRTKRHRFKLILSRTHSYLLLLNSTLKRSMLVSYIKAKTVLKCIDGILSIS